MNSIVLDGAARDGGEQTALEREEDRNITTGLAARDWSEVCP